MGHAWIVGVLDDLRTYAELNGLDRLAASLAGTALEAEEVAGRGAAEGASLGASLGGAAARGRWHRDGPGPRLGADRRGAGPR